MEFISAELNDYVEAHTQDEPVVLSELFRETYANILMPRMISGNLQGQMLRMFSLMIRPKQILELGTYTGYSAICLSEGLQEGGQLHTIDNNEELEEITLRYIQKAGLQQKIKYYRGDAMEIIDSIDEVFDLVFIDADKINYSAYYDKVMDKLRPGGFIFADNVLWSAKVLLDKNKMDKDTKAIDEFNKKVHNDIRVEHVMLPVRDGIMLIRKKESL
jgi:caffeoyl-CoA O-methyltransferase